MLPRPLVAIALALALPSPALAQAWSVGRPDAQPEFDTPVAPSYKAPPSRQMPITGANGANYIATVTRRPATGVVAEGDSTVVDELDVVVRRVPGPAMYTVSRGDAQVVVMASWSPIPQLLQWDQRRFASNLEGARAVLMPPEPKIGVFQGAALALRAGAVRLPGYTPLQNQLPPPLRAKFLQAARIAHQNPAKYAKWRPAAAGLWMLGDFRRAAGFSDLKPGTTIARMARAKGVRVEYAGRLGVNAAVGALLSMSQPQQLACLDAASDQVIYEAAHARAAAQAWAQGRLREVKANANDAVLDRCLLSQSGVRAVLDRSAGDAAMAIEDALKRPGKTIAVIDLRLLDRPDGVLDRLKARGAAVSVPNL